MGFLLGVFDAVKDDDAVRTYDKDISGDKIDTVISMLQSSIGSGRDGLVDAVGAVKAWLEGYGEKVREKNNLVTTPIENIKTEIGEHIKDQSTPQKPIDQQINEWTTRADDYLSKVKSAEGALVDIDSKLKDKLKCPINMLLQATKTFREDARNRDLEELNKTAAAELTKLEKEVKDFVNFRVIRMGNEIEGAFNEQIQKPITNVKDKLAQVDADLKSWIEEATKVIQQVKQKAQQVHDRLEAHVKKIAADADKVQKEAEKQVSAKLITVDGLLNEAESNSRALDESCSKSERHLKTLKESAEEVIRQATYNVENIKELNREITGDLKQKLNMVSFHVKGLELIGMQEKFEMLLHNVYDAIGNLSEAVVGQKDKSIKKMLEKLKREDIDGLKNAIETANEDFKELDERQYPTVKYFKDLMSSDKNENTIFARFQKAVAIDQKGKNVSDHPNFAGKVDEAINAVNTEVTSINATFASEIKKALTTAVDDAAAPIAKIKAFAAAISHPDSGFPHNLLDVKHQITSLQVRFQSLIDAVRVAKMKHYVSDLLGALRNAKMLIVKYIKGIAHDFKMLTAELTALQGELQKDNVGHDVITTLNDFLSQGIQSTGEWKDKTAVKGLTEIEKRIANILGIGDEGDAPNDLNTIVTKANAFYTSVLQAEAREAMREIAERVKQEFSITTKNIEARAQWLYANRKKKELEELKNIVDSQKSEIRNIIDKDRASGIKCLLWYMNHNRGKLTELTGINEFNYATEKCKHYFDPLVEYIKAQVKNTIKPATTNETTDPYIQLTKIKEHFDKLLGHLQKDDKKYNFDNKFTSLLTTLSTSLTALTPSAFANPRHPELLDAVKKGLQGFVQEMERVYVNKYDGDPAVYFSWNGTFTSELNDLGKNCVRVFLTIVNILHEDLDKLNYKCDGDWRRKLICEMDGEDDNPLGQFMKRCGYKVAGNKDSKEGELNFPSRDFTGKNIHSKLNATKFGDDQVIAQHLLKCESNEEDEEGEKVKKHNFDFFDLLNCLLSHVNEYNEVCYLSTLQARRQPCSVYEMLVWLSGLPHHPVYTDMRDVTTLGIIDGLNKKEEEEFSVSFVDDSSSLEAYPDKITYNSVQGAVTEVCSKAYDTVVCIAGTGDAQTVYGCDYSNNSFNFYYPQDGEGCLDMFLDVLRRLFPPLKFLRNQCKYRSNHLGWRDCQYGMDVPMGKSQCTEHSRDQVTGQPKCQANSKVNCQPNSPLMSYLNDCLPGHLPHHLTKIGCKYECATCPSTLKKGIPCMTPLGFRGFSGSIKTGKDICAILDSFFSIRKVETLFTLLPKPPSSVPEHFGFALSLVGGWYDNDNLNKNDVQTAFEESIKNVSIHLVDQPNELTDAITNAYGSGYTKHSSCEHNHVKNLTTGDICSDKKNVDCAPYMSSLCADSYYYVAKAHSDTYLSWAVYLPWNFWTLLNNLYQDFCNINCQDWGCRNCLNSRQCKRGQHGLTEKVDKKPEIPHCKCDSMVKCKGVAPTFYRYGFSFGNVIALNMKSKEKLCSNFCTQLRNVLESKYFTDLFDTCDKFIFTIRAPFIWLNVALWLLSLLYLLHIMVIRLDLLHIKSHLHSPSSHRIAAQSLLAAARVNKLNRVFYLQP
ncbi:hypothetical protein, conserved [Babesia bigemina]|uniref:C3H1-type domain-containing protein n=1 Tax=Babesia bigemina TaxID=5866 RepID=A0A061BSC6_BABBI|nr:hypothetical protein, conserved [Babesia bigemina]CDR71446.1 hypothetical protein, conserved [Babesia bigemina]|eukprot:XP_012770394.1 hypothetical protein, conserved [Babesia bigemina]